MRKYTNLTDRLNKEYLRHVRFSAEAVERPSKDYYNGMSDAFSDCYWHVRFFQDEKKDLEVSAFVDLLHWASRHFAADKRIYWAGRVNGIEKMFEFMGYTESEIRNIRTTGVQTFDQAFAVGGETANQTTMNTATKNYRSDFVPRQFEVDASETPLKGFAFVGDYWNGWGCPYFDFETMQTLASIYSDGEYWNISYCADTDEFLFEDLLSGDDTEPNVIQKIGSTIINGMKLYKAHELCWCFHEMPTPEKYIVSFAYTEWLQVQVTATSEGDAIENLKIPQAYFERLNELQKEFGLRFCDSELDNLTAERSINR